MGRFGRGVAAALALCALGSGALAQADFARQQAEQDKVPDTPGDGPYPTTMGTDPTLGSYVIYRPADLAPLRPGKLGVFIWGNGGCADDGASSRQHLAEIASYGYLVIAPGKWRSGPNARDPRAAPGGPGPDGKFPPPPTSADDLRKALDWALAEDGRADSPYAGLVDHKAIAVGGYSCGGAQAIDVSADARIGAVVIQNSGLFNAGGSAMGGSMALGKTALGRFHTPVLYLLGGPTDIAYPNGTDDFARIGHVPVVLVNIPTGHGGTYGEPMGGKGARIVIDWLEWQLRGNRQAEKTFIGEDCSLCRDPDAQIERKNFP
ncbi:MAG: hypothetical protein P0Y56_12085 [Candidatus Andeanibacterium colombiense]|uniref:Alpha/beta hydrolase n=1 Tax=Candidatus Andeanibacterium colombiense TaxID=3121345 RepID=A0AAJ5X4E5_9SPHN|nr:MAG: hypothetical protein P0Y56_12085 [Sphingomonadaceae bacterium]